jgi:muramoyltetrapeptide carboxypeptidase
MTIRQPPALRPGDRIGIAAPAGPVDEARLDAGIAYLAARGFTTVPGDHLRSRHGYLAGDDPDRLADLNRFIADPTIKAIWFARGGYGSMRLLPGLELRPLRTSPKALIGYSDVTAVQSAALRHSRLASFQGPMVAELGNGEAFDEGSLWAALGEESPVLRHAAPGAVVREGVGEGPLVGGCLSVLVSLIGTHYEVNTNGAILFWEEVGEEPFRIDRMLAHLRLSGRLANLKGMVVGRLVECRARDPRNDLPLAEILDTHLRGTRYPVVVDFPAGHCAGKKTLPLGRPARLDTGAETLTIGRD